jgi:diguanylate cyclase (GGDEF)-like protein
MATHPPVSQAEITTPVDLGPPASPNEEAFARSVLDALASHIAVVDADGVIVTVNRAWREYAQANGGDPRLTSEGINYFDACQPMPGEGAEEAQRMTEGLNAVLSGRRSDFEMEYPCHCKREPRWFIARVTPCHGGGRAAAVISHENITERKLLENRLERRAYYDQLTDLPNRTLLHSRLEQAHRRCVSSEGEPFAVLFLDFDGFKRVNDTLGHEVGDELLKAIAGRLRDATKATVLKDQTDAGGAMVARLGGDEFVVVVDPIHEVSRAKTLADRLIEAMAKPFPIAGHALEVGVSIGVAIGTCKSEDADALLRDADIAMYEAKQAQRGFAIFEPAMRERASN